MIGAAYEKRAEKESLNSRQAMVKVEEKMDSRDMITLLGSILTLQRSVLEQREFVANQYEKFKNGTLLDDDISLLEKPYVPKPVEVQKRKRGFSEDAVYFDASDLSSEEDAQLQASSKKGKEAAPSVPKKKKSKDTKPGKDQSDDDGDITAYYGMQSMKINNPELEETDGLDYKRSHRKIAQLPKRSTRNRTN